jgi:UDP-glucose 4-epimerase
MTTVLVTGAAGFIGGQLAAHFRAQGARVFVDVPRDDAGVTRRWPLGEAALLQATGGEVPDAIVHAAGSGTVGKVAAQPTLELPANLGAMLAVLQYAVAHAPRAQVVLLSSAALYGNAPPVPQHEADARAPVSLYGVAKAQAEQLAAYYAAQHGLAATAVRLFSVYGPGLRKQLLWDAMTRFAAATGPASFFGTGRELRDWVHIDDVCRFMSRLLERPPRPGFEVFNCGGSPATTGQVLAALAQAAGAEPPRFSGQVRAGDPACLVADCGKAARELGWRAAVPWAEGVAGYAQWFRAAGAGAGSRA